MIYYPIVIFIIFMVSYKPSLMIFGLCMFALITFKQKYEKLNTNKHVKNTDSIWKTYNSLVKDKLVFSKNTVNIYKGTSNLKYIMMHEDIKGIMEDLEFILKFQPDIIIDILILLEYFYKIHYNVMIEKYEPCSYVPILRDLEKEIINIFSTFVYNLPDISTTIAIGNIDEFMLVKLRDIQSILQRYMNILKNKFKCYHKFEFNEYDYTMDKHMLV